MISKDAGPCVNYIDDKKYKETIEDAKKFLRGNTNKIEKKLIAKMKLASKKSNI